MVHALHMIRSSLIVPTENVPTWDLCHSTKRINFLSSKQMLFLKVMKGVLNLLNNGTTLCYHIPKTYFLILRGFLCRWRSGVPEGRQTHDSFILATTTKPCGILKEINQYYPSSTKHHFLAKLFHKSTFSSNNKFSAVFQMFYEWPS